MKDTLSAETKPKKEPQSVSLTIKERLYVLNVLPPTGSYKELCRVRGIADKMRFTKEENVQYGIMEVPGGIKVDQSFDSVEFGISFTPNELDLIKGELELDNAQKRLNVGNMSLFEKFGCEDKSEDKLIENLETPVA